MYILEVSMQEPSTLWNWKYLVFVGLQTLNFALFYVACPVIPKYAVSIGLDLGIAGILSGGFAIASLVARPVAGYSIDHYERKRIMMGALVLCGLSTAALVLSQNWIILLLLRVVYGASFSFFQLCWSAAQLIIFLRRTWQRVSATSVWE